MRGADSQQAHLFSCMLPERRVPADHSLRPIRVMVDAALEQISPRFEALYSHTGWPAVPPEKLLRAIRRSTSTASGAATPRTSPPPIPRRAGAARARAGRRSLAYLGNLLMDNREGVAVAAQVSIATGAAESLAALELVEKLEHRAAQITAGADKAYDNEGFVEGMRFMAATPHVA